MKGQTIIQNEGFDFSGSRILIVEDIEMYMEIEAKRLSLAGFTVDKASNGKEAVDTYLSMPAWSYQAIIMDIIMPEMDGREAATLIRRSGRDDALCVPIISVSAVSDEEEIRLSLSAGIDDFVSKPIDFNDLFEKLSRLTKGHPAMKTAAAPPAVSGNSGRYNKLWKLLIDKGMTKTQLRKAIGCSSTTIAKMTKGDIISMKLLIKICEAMQCGLDDIMEPIGTDK